MRRTKKVEEPVVSEILPFAAFLDSPAIRDTQDALRHILEGYVGQVNTPIMRTMLQQRIRELVRSEYSGQDILVEVTQPILSNEDSLNPVLDQHNLSVRVSHGWPLNRIAYSQTF